MHKHIAMVTCPHCGQPMTAQAIAYARAAAKSKATEEAACITTSPLQRLPRPRKPSFPFLCLAHQVQPEVQAQQSGLPLLTVLALTSGIGTTEEIAQRALDGLNALKGTCYTLAGIEIDLHRR